MIIVNGDEKECTNINKQNIFGSTLCGSIIFPTDTEFIENAKQYAYYSAPNHFSPSILLIAECDQDISIILDFAYRCDYKISLRSGGHQFAGLSSCNSNEYNCIQIILKNYNDLNIFTDNKTAIAQVGVSLETLFKELDKKDLFIPGGAESSVALGGHCQTGGVGYLMRSFGLFIDTIYAFDMMIYNGTFLHITHNSYPDLFWAVLGGGPGNWGVILKLYMNVLSNTDYPNVIGINYMWMYDKEVAQQTGLTWLELNNNDIINQYDDTLMLWAIVPNFDVNAHMVLISYLFFEDVNNRNWDTFGYDNILKPFLDLNISTPIVNMTIKNHTISSLIANEFLIPSVLVPEYRYSMRAQGTTQTWNEDYIYDVVDKADILINNNINEIGVNIKIGLEILIEKYGGAVVDNSIFDRDVDSTSLAWRDLTQGMGIRIFYKDDNAGEIQSKWQEDSWKYWLSVPEFYNDEDIRYYGYSHVTNEEGEFDMDKQWKYYYRNENRYNKLKQIKQSIDPCDIFHFVFSIPVDDNSQCPQKDANTDSVMKINTFISFFVVIVITFKIM